MADYTAVKLLPGSIEFTIDTSNLPVGITTSIIVAEGPQGCYPLH